MSETRDFALPHAAVLRHVDTGCGCARIELPRKACPTPIPQSDASWQLARGCAQQLQMPNGLLRGAYQRTGASFAAAASSTGPFSLSS